jgi:hypothetical protein
MAPGPLLAMILDTAAGPDGEGLAALSDGQLVGFLSGARRMESRLAWAKMAALGEFASRPRRQDFAADEIAAAFRLTWLSAAGEIQYAQAVARRLPVTFAALAAGKIDTRDLVAAAAANPATRWCLTALNRDGTAASHACAAGSHPWPPGPAGPAGQGPPGSTGQGPPGPITFRGLMDFLNITGLTPVIRGPCDHTGAEDRYRPGRKLQHLVKARNATCSAPGCGRRAMACDLDHTDPHHQGGRTCECNLAPLCRHHHRCKQADGWRLEQPEPGVLVWHTPTGRTYTTTPTQYAA